MLLSVKFYNDYDGVIHISLKNAFSTAVNSLLARCLVI